MQGKKRRLVGLIGARRRRGAKKVGKQAGCVQAGWQAGRLPFAFTPPLPFPPIPSVAGMPPVYRQTSPTHSSPPHLPSASPKLIPSASLPPTTHSSTAPVTPLLPPPLPALLPALLLLPLPLPPLAVLLLRRILTTAGAAAADPAATPAAAPPRGWEAPLQSLLPALAAAMQSAYSCRSASTSPALRGSRNTRLRAASWRSRPLCCHLQGGSRR